jgi:hypothetical protein
MFQQIELAALPPAAGARKPRPATTKSAIGPVHFNVDAHQGVWRGGRIEQAGKAVGLHGHTSGAARAVLVPQSLFEHGASHQHICPQPSHDVEAWQILQRPAPPAS